MKARDSRIVHNFPSCLDCKWRIEQGGDYQIINSPLVYMYTKLSALFTKVRGKCFVDELLNLSGLHSKGLWAFCVPAKLSFLSSLNATSVPPETPKV